MLAGRRATTIAVFAFAFVQGSARFPAFAQAPQPPATEIGTIAGTVLDKSGAQPIIDAGVEIVGQNRTARTDVDGKYAVKLPPGTYELRIFAPGYSGLRLRGIVVKAGQVARGDAALGASGQANVETVEVIAQANRAAEAVQLLKRKNSPVVSDTVNAEVIAKSPASNAADVVQRVPAVTVKDQFIFVRGLGPRYSTALLNGSRLPSTDPEKRVVPLDLFPATFLESLDIEKSYTPDLPGDFSGGLTDIHLREFPEKLDFNLGLSASGNTQTTFQRFKTYRGGSLDYLGFGSNFRKLPEDVPDSKTFIADTNAEQTSAVARSFKDIWSLQNQTAPPNSGLNLSLGDSFGALGLELAGIYTTEYKSRREHDLQYANASTPAHPMITKIADFTFDNDRFETRLGGVFTAAYKLADNHKLTFRSLIDRNTTDQVVDGDAEAAASPGQILHETRLRYTEDELDFGQLAGEHRWPWVWLDWRTAFSRTMENEPDTRHLTYEGPPGQPGVFENEAQGGLRIFNDLRETLTDSAVDFTVPFKTALPGTDFWSGLPGKIKFGPAYSFQDRDFTQRRFRYRIFSAGAFDRHLPAEQLLAPNNLLPGLISFSEETLPKDAFHATQEVAGAYGMVELPLVRDRLRVVGGVRAEYSYIVLDTFDDAGKPVRPKKNNTDLLPGVNLIYSPREDTNVRFGYSESVSRPEFRELSPVQFPTPRGLRATIGNPNLIEATIRSYDLRWEWFFSPLELVSLGGFYKELDRPIEQVVIVLSSDVANSFANARDATLKGFEFEARKDFGFLGRPLRNLSLQANVAYIDSEVNAPRAKKLQVQTLSQRPLQGQAPYIVNAVLDYTHPEWGTIRLLYNTAGSRIDSAGSFGLPDIIEEPRDQLDAVIVVPLKRFGLPLTAKMAAENLLDDTVLFDQGGRLQQQYTLGIKATFGVSYSF